MFSWRYFVHKRWHPSVFIAFVAVGIVAGVALSPVVTYSFSGFSWLVISIMLLAGCFVWQRAGLVIIAVIAGLLLGLWRGDQQTVKIETYKRYFGQTIHVSGVINEDTNAGKRGEMQIELGDIRINNEKLPEKIWVSSYTKLTIKRSDHVTVEGKLKPGFGNFAASMGYAKIINHKKGVDAARDTRDWFASAIRKAIPEPQASLGLGFLVGQRSSLPLELDKQLQIVGLTHIVVASGYNLTILVRLARRLLARVSKYLTAISSLGMITGFIFITGFSPSMSRAGLVAFLSLAAWYYGRKISPFILLPLAAAATLIVNPSFAWGDVGWYLSFAAFGGVMIIAPLIQAYFFGEQKPSFLRQIVGETTAALLATAPIVMLIFSQYSPYALLSNLLVVPVIPFIMLAVFVGGVASIILPFLSPIISLPAMALLQYVTSIVGWIASFPGAQSEATIQPIGLIGYYASLVLIGYYMWLKTKHNFREDNIIE